MPQNILFPFLTLEQHTTYEASMINRLSNLINRNCSAAKILQVLCSNAHAFVLDFGFGVGFVFCGKRLTHA